MRADVQAKLAYASDWLPAELTTERAEGPEGQAVVMIDGQARGKAEVYYIRVTADVSVELVDAAIAAGNFVIGQPRG